MAGTSNKENVPQLNKDGTRSVRPKNAEWAKGYVDSLDQIPGRELGRHHRAELPER